MSMRDLGLNGFGETVIAISGNLYVKSSEALQETLARLNDIGYSIQDLRQADHRLERGTSVETMERDGWSLWYASLKDIRYGECKSCGNLVSTLGIRVHGRRCEHCGDVLYYQLVDGSTLRFEFLDSTESRGFFSPQLNMRVKRWNDRTGYLYLYPHPMKGGFGVLTGKRARAYLHAHRSQWDTVKIDGHKYIRIKHDVQWDRRKAVIEPLDSWGQYHNHRIVKVWDGNRYPEYGFGDEALPLPDSISIYEAWHWAPLPASPTLHRRILSAAGQTDDKGWHYQDGTPWFRDGHWKQMSRFVRHFTQLNADAFDAAWPRFRSDGPGGIDDIAHFCDPKPEVTDRPNFGNTLVALGRGLSGGTLSESEAKAAKRGLEDPLARSLYR